jgi:hypothetical protein
LDDLRDRFLTDPTSPDDLHGGRLARPSIPDRSYGGPAGGK